MAHSRHGWGDIKPQSAQARRPLTRKEIDGKIKSLKELVDLEENDVLISKIHVKNIQKKIENFEKEVQKTAHMPDYYERDRTRPQSAAIRSPDMKSLYRFDPVMKKFLKIDNDQLQMEEDQSYYNMRIEASHRKVMEWLSKMDQSRQIDPADNTLTVNGSEDY